MPRCRISINKVKHVVLIQSNTEDDHTFAANAIESFMVKSGSKIVKINKVDGTGAAASIAETVPPHAPGQGDTPDEYYRDVLLRFATNQAQTSLDFPAALNSYDRALVHRFAGDIGLAHKSKGRGPARHITVWKSSDASTPAAHAPILSDASTPAGIQSNTADDDMFATNSIASFLQKSGIGIESKSK